MPTTLLVIGASAVSLVLLVLAAFGAARSFYKVPNADEALVRTGGSKPVVSTGAGIWAVPVVSKVTRVSLRAVRIPINRTGEEALPSADRIPAEIQGELLVRVDSSNDAHIILAAQALGSESAATGHHDGRMERVIQEQVDSLVTDALRTAAFKKTFEELNAQKKEFADEVMVFLGEDLAKLGLVLVAVTIPSIRQGAFTRDDGDVFAAEGRRNVAGTVAKARQETNEIMRAAEVRVQEQDVAARKRQLTLDLEQKRLEADQARSVAEYEATQSAETRRLVLAQEQVGELATAEQARAVALARTEQDRLIEIAKIEKEQGVAVAQARAAAEQKKAEEEGARVRAEAEIARTRAVSAAEIERDQAIKVADEQRQQAVSEAAVVREVALASKRADEARARAEQAKAEAEHQRAQQLVVTVEAESAADRDRKVVVIKAQEEAEKQRIAADRDAYVQTRRAEADRDAAGKRAEAASAEAEGRARAALADAEGQANALKALALGEADARRTRADADADASVKEGAAKTALARATLKEGEARAESERLLVEARNAVSRDLLVRDVLVAAIEQAPAIVHEVMAPVAAVSKVQVLRIDGLGGGAGGEVSVPGAVLGAGLAASGALPLIREAMQALRANEDVREIVGSARDVATTAIRDAALAARGEKP